MSEVKDIDKKLDDSDNRVSRRTFLKVLGTSSAIGVAGCADSARQNIFPNVKGQPEQIPGVAVWYNSTCAQCSAGCGIQVRNREGRSVKIEGNPDHPINKGGLCAVGHSSLQATYNPDRIRQPLKKVGKENKLSSFKPISWEDAYKEIGKGISNGKNHGVLTGELTGTLSDLFSDFANSLGAELASYNPLSRVDVATASELVFGSYGIPELNFEKAEVVLSFGADFLETWISPCEYARSWSASRKSQHPLKFIHIEPRLSLTGANADLWLSAKPHTEILIAKLILKELLKKGHGKSLRKELRNRLVAQVDMITPSMVEKKAGISHQKISKVVSELSEAKHSLVLPGSLTYGEKSAEALSVVVAFINLVLGNVGETVNLSKLRKPKSSFQKASAIFNKAFSTKLDTIIWTGVNPIYCLPTELKAQQALEKVKLKVALTDTFDETSVFADYILPINSDLEGWGDSFAVSGVYSLRQPTMTPVYDTQDLGTILLKLAAILEFKDLTKNGTEFHEYLQQAWKKVHKKYQIKADFKSFWLSSVEKGGYFSELNSSRVRVKVDNKAFDVMSFAVKSISDDLVLYTYPSTKSFDGTAANRPWLQELPDPITKIVWDVWGEIHPSTAKKLHVKDGDVVEVKAETGTIQLPLYVTEHVNPGTVAVPLGQGHTKSGRYADVVSHGNAFSLLSVQTANKGFPIKVALVKTTKNTPLVNVQGSDLQLGRGLARTRVLGVHGDKHDEHGAAHHEQPKQMYEQRKAPLHNWGMAVDLAACTGCSACVVACYAENNVPVVGKEVCSQGREMSWIRIERYFDGGHDELSVSFLPMMCQQCDNAPCEPVCPVYATNHSEEGLNVMAYNRCVGTRYCANNCSYKVRRFNWFEFDLPTPADWQLNPDVTKRVAGVMEKCTFCVQRIVEGKDRAKDLGRLVADGDIKPACVQSCPTQALTFGDLNDPTSQVSKLSENDRAYKVLDHHINTQPSVSYLENKRYKIET